MRSGIRAFGVGAFAFALTLSSAPVGATTSSAQPLVGTFRIAPGACRGGQATGSTFRMVLPGGSRSGPFVTNNDSACSDHTYTLLSPGSDGGLVTGGYQAEPAPAFDGNGNGLAARITKPARFYGVDFSTATNPTDPQTRKQVPAPAITATGSTLSGDLRAFAASWNRQEFNQGAPKPDGSTPGNTTQVTGTFDAATGRFTLAWASQIQGGPFDNFTGVWHLEGTFAPAGTATAAAAGGSEATTPPPAASHPGSGTAPGAASAPTAVAPTVSAGSGDGGSPATVPSTATTAASRSGSSTDRAQDAAAPVVATKASSSSGRGPVAAVAALLLTAIAAAAVTVLRRSHRTDGASR
jgi:hypothetical protein